jgi:hypothetical protein
MLNKELHLNISGKIIDHLGIQMYQSPVAAVAETVANAWDADASEVKIALPDRIDDNAVIVINDNGNGMTFEECQNRFLTAGYNKRGSDPRASSDGGRPLLGRKGIDLLAVIDSQVFKTMLMKTLFASLDIESDIQSDFEDDIERPIVNTIFFNIEPNKIIMISTNGFRMSIVEQSILSESTNNFILPVLKLNELRECLINVAGDISISKIDNFVHFKKAKAVTSFSNTSISTSSSLLSLPSDDTLHRIKTIQSSQGYPIPEKLDVTNNLLVLQLPVKTLLQLLLRTVTPEGNNSIFLTIKENLLILTNEWGKTPYLIRKEKLQINHHNVPKMEIKINVKYLLDFLIMCDAKMFFLKIKSNAEFLLFEEDGNKNYKYLVMPMKPTSRMRI